ATPEELAAIARAGAAPPLTKMAVSDAASAAELAPEETIVPDEVLDAERTRRRRRRGGRRRRGRSPDATAGDNALMAPGVNGSAAPIEPPEYTPEFPAYAVDIEPMPPPTKRRPAR